MKIMLILLLGINILMLLMYKWSIHYEGPVAVPIEEYEKLNK